MIDIRHYMPMWINRLARFSNPRRIWRGSFVLIGLILLVAFFASHSNWTQKNYDETVRRGNTIIAALEAYHKRYEEYPRALEELRPIYLKEILPPVVGNGQWQYSNNVGNISGGFSLVVGEHLIENDPETDPIMWYSPDTKGWPVDTR